MMKLFSQDLKRSLNLKVLKSKKGIPMESLAVKESQ